MNCETCKHNTTMDYADLVGAPTWARGSRIFGWCDKYQQATSYIKQFTNDFSDCYEKKN